MTNSILQAGSQRISDRPAARGRPKLGSLRHQNGYYDETAAGYAARTLSASAPPLFDAFRSRLHPGAQVLDLGCGAGRDLRLLRQDGVDAMGLDLSPTLASIARETSGAAVVQGDMRSLDFEASSFDGALAVASLLHLSLGELRDQLCRIRGWLRPSGSFFVSMKVGGRADAMADGRVFTYVAADWWPQMLQDAGFSAPEMARSAPSRHSSSDHEWLTALAMRSR